MTKYVGIDPSLNGTGICTGLHDAYSLTFRGRGSDPKGDARLCRIYDTIAANVSPQADVVCIEDLPPYQSGSATLGLVQGVVRAALAASGVKVYGVSPMTLKKAVTGSGKATKEDMRDAIASSRCGSQMLDSILSWDDNAIDAWWLRQVGMALSGEPSLLAEMPSKWTVHK